jgi:hypothetical protein
MLTKPCQNAGGVIGSAQTAIQDCPPGYTTGSTLSTGEAACNGPNGLCAPGKGTSLAGSKVASKCVWLTTTWPSLCLCRGRVRRIISQLTASAGITSREGLLISLKVKCLTSMPNDLLWDVMDLMLSSQAEPICVHVIFVHLVCLNCVGSEAGNAACAPLSEACWPGCCGRPV